MYLISLLITALFLLSSQGYAQELTEVEKTYYNHRRGENLGFKTVPVDHMIPTSKTVVLALDAETENTRVISENMVNFPTISTEDSIEVSGYRLAPFAGLSLQNVAFGLAVEKGLQNYVVKSGYYSNEARSIFNGSEQNSSIDYWGMGFNVYLNPFPKFKRVFWTFFLGSRLINATHSTKFAYYADGSISYQIPNPAFVDGEFETKKYSITKTTIGSTFNIKLGKRARLIPWMDYSIVDLEDFKFVVGESTSDQKVSNWLRFNNDAEMFWNSANPLSYGVDFSLKFKRFDIHLGDLLNLVSQSVLLDNKQIEREEGYSISFSYDFKAR